MSETNGMGGFTPEEPPKIIRPDLGDKIEGKSSRSQSRSKTIIQEFSRPEKRAMRYFLIVLLVIFVAAAWWLFHKVHQNDSRVAVSTVEPARNVKFQAGENAPQNYSQNYNNYENTQGQSAAKTGKSFSAGYTGTASKDVLITPEQNKHVNKPKIIRPPVVVMTVPPETPYLVKEMKALDNNFGAGQPMVPVYVAQPQAQQSATSAGGVNQQAPGVAPAGSAPLVKTDNNIEVGLPIIGAGDILYAVIDTSLNSNQNTPVLATVEQGPFKNYKLLGSFKTVNDRLVIQFTTATSPNKVPFAIDAVAVNANTNRAAVANAVNHHYLGKFGLLLGGALLQGFGQSVQQSGTSVISGLGGIESVVSPRTMLQNGLSSLGTVGQTLGQIGVSEFNSIKDTVREFQGEGVGILFLKPVMKNTLANAASGIGQTPNISSGINDKENQAKPISAPAAYNQSPSAYGQYPAGYGYVQNQAVGLPQAAPMTPTYAGQ